MRAAAVVAACPEPRVIGGEKRDAARAFAVQHEKRLVLPLVVSSTLLFFIGMAFAYFFVFGTVFHFIATVVPTSMQWLPDSGEYLDFVLGNKVMVGTVNANRDYFETGVRDLAQAALEYGGWLERLLTDPVRGLENYAELFAKLTNPNGAVKIFCEVADFD